MTEDDKKTINAKFRAVILSEVNRLPIISRIALVSDEIDEATRIGYTQKQIVDLLKTIGLGMTLKQYQNSLYQIRKKNKKNKPAKVPATPAAATPTPAPPAAPATPASVTSVPAATAATGDTHSGSGKSRARQIREKNQNDPEIDALFNGRY